MVTRKAGPTVGHTKEDAVSHVRLGSMRRRKKGGGRPYEGGGGWPQEGAAVGHTRRQRSWGLGVEWGATVTAMAQWQEVWRRRVGVAGEAGGAAVARGCAGRLWWQGSGKTMVAAVVAQKRSANGSHSGAG